MKSRIPCNTKWRNAVICMKTYPLQFKMRLLFEPLFTWWKVSKLESRCWKRCLSFLILIVIERRDNWGHSFKVKVRRYLKMGIDVPLVPVRGWNQRLYEQSYFSQSVAMKTNFLPNHNIMKIVSLWTFQNSKVDRQTDRWRRRDVTLYKSRKPH